MMFLGKNRVKRVGSLKKLTLSALLFFLGLATLGSLSLQVTACSNCEYTSYNCFSYIVNPTESDHCPEGAAAKELVERNITPDVLSIDSNAEPKLEQYGDGGTDSWSKLKCCYHYTYVQCALPQIPEDATVV
jgi:hypothetical protein